MKKIKLTLLFLFLCTLGINAQEQPKQITLFTNVMVFDGTTNELLKRDVLVENNIIKQISEEPLAIIASENAKIIDGKGMTLMPGLIDAHVHLNMLAGSNLSDMENATWDEIATAATAATMEYLESGFTTVRGMGSIGGLGLKKVIDAGYIAGPRIYPSGSYISQTAGHGDLLSSSQQLHPERSNMANLGIIHLVDGVDEMRLAVRRNFARGASQIKIMVGGGISSVKGALAFSQFSDEEILTAVEEAERLLRPQHY